MKAEEKRKPLVSPVREKRTTLERVKKFAAQHREALEALAKRDGPVEQTKETTDTP